MTENTTAAPAAPAPTPPSGDVAKSPEPAMQVQENYLEKAVLALLERSERTDKTIEKMALALKFVNDKLSKKELVVDAENAKADKLPNDKEIRIETHVSSDSAVSANKAPAGTEGAFTKGQQAVQPGPAAGLSEDAIKKLVDERVKASMPVPRGAFIDPISKSEVNVYDWMRTQLKNEVKQNGGVGSVTPEQSHALYSGLTKANVEGMNTRGGLL